MTSFRVAMLLVIILLASAVSAAPRPEVPYVHVLSPRKARVVKLFEGQPEVKWNWITWNWYIAGDVMTACPHGVVRIQVRNPNEWRFFQGRKEIIADRNGVLVVNMGYGQLLAGK